MSECDHATTTIIYDHKRKTEITACEECGKHLAEMRICDNCLKPFEGPDATGTEKIYCSERCYREVLK